MSENMRIWKQADKPPSIALEAIGAGRLKGKTSINPQWRLEMATRIFGPQGIGWKYEIVEHWTDQAHPDGEVIQHVRVNFYYKDGGEWSEPVPGVGGKVLFKRESSGKWFANDEALKMAVTDALGVAMKGLGFGAAVYYNLWDGDKYRDLGADEALAAAWIDKMLEASEGPLKHFAGWWTRNGDTIKEECGTEPAALVWEAFNKRLNAVRKEVE